MRKWLIPVLALALLVAPAAGQDRPDPQGRRAQLEQQVRQQFLRQVARRLELTDPQQERLLAVLREGAEARQELAEESRRLRHDLMQAVRTNDTDVSTYEGLLDRLGALREQEWALARQEEDRLADVLDARQRAIFLIMRMQFNDRIRGMRGRHPGPGPGGPGGPAGGGPPA